MWHGSEPCVQEGRSSIGRTEGGSGNGRGTPQHAIASEGRASQGVRRGAGPLGRGRRLSACARKRQTDGADMQLNVTSLEGQSTPLVLSHRIIQAVSLAFAYERAEEATERAT